MSDLTRRELLGMLAAAPLTRAFGADPGALERASRHARASAVAVEPYQALFFTPDEMRTVRLLADLVLPADERSGSAGDAGVPEFIDFTVSDRPGLQVPVRGGLRWLDAESVERFGAPFVALDEAQRAAILDDIAWPERAPPEKRHGVVFFNRFRDLVASGFFTSRMGMDDLRFVGNRAVREYTGCPEEAVRGLGVSYESWDGRYGT